MVWKCSRKNGSGSKEIYQRVVGGGEASRGVTTSRTGRGGALETKAGDSLGLFRGAQELEH